MKRRLNKVQITNEPEEQSIGNIHTREQSTKGVENTENGFRDTWDMIKGNNMIVIWQLRYK